MADVSCDFAKTRRDIEAVKQIFLEYLRFVEDFLGEDLGFQGTEKEFADFSGTYDCLVLGKLDGKPVAACGIKRLSDTDCELKRLYCRLEGRGYGFGQNLTALCISEARKLGYRRILLDTNPGLTYANRIYEVLGFVDIEKYYENPLTESRYMALAL